MLTRRSREEGIASPSDAETLSKSKRSATPSKRSKTPSKRSKTPSKRSKTPPNSKKTVTRLRSNRKSVERRMRTRSRSANKTEYRTSPRVVLERYIFKPEDPVVKKKEIKNKNAVELDDSKSPVKEVNSITSPTERNISGNISETSSLIPRSRFDYNEESDDETKLSDSITRKTYPVEFGGTFGIIILNAFLPALLVLAEIDIKTKENLIPFPRGYLRLANYYDQDVFLWTAAIVFLQLLISLSLVPLAKKSKSLTRLPPDDDFNFVYYRFSGFFNLIIAGLIIFAMDYYKCPINFVLEIVTKKTVPHIVASVLYTFIISLILFIKAKYTNQIDNSSSFNFVQKLFIGTKINPTSINIKLAFCRYSTLMTILFNYLVIMDSLKNPVNIHLYFVAGLQILHALDKLIFEYNLLSSFYLQNEKVGYWTIIQQFLQPIINFLPIQILLANNLPVNYIILSISSFIFLFGYFCQRYSDFTKYQYERNLPLVYRSPYVRTIVHGLWSYVRYPNYMGTILVHLALILPIFEPNVGSLQESWPVLLCRNYFAQVSMLMYECCSKYYPIVWICRNCLTCPLSKEAVEDHITKCNGQPRQLNQAPPIPTKKNEETSYIFKYCYMVFRRGVMLKKHLKEH